MARIINADTLDGYHASDFSFANHNHDDRYFLKSYIQYLEQRIAILEQEVFGGSSSS